MFTLKKRDPTELPFEVLEQAHWRPREVQLCEKHKPEDRKGKEFLRLRTLWRQKEVFINFALNSLLMSLTSKELATLANNLSGRKFSPETGLFGGYSQALKKTIGVPDFILSDGDAADIGETKLAAKFGFNQYIKYQSFAMMCRAAQDLPNEFSVTVVVRDKTASRAFSGINQKWNPTINSASTLELDQATQDRAKKTFQTNAKNIAQIWGIGPKFYRSIIDHSGKLVPVQAVSWNEFASTLRNASERPETRLNIENL